jgi:hypothetical protein
MVFGPGGVPHFVDSFYYVLVAAIFVANSCLPQPY